MVFNQLDIHFTDYGHLCGDIIRLDMLYDRMLKSVFRTKLKAWHLCFFVLGLYADDNERV